jgi:hypothetical protein
MRTTRKDVVTRFENMKNFCKELEHYSIFDSGIKNMVTIGIVSEGRITGTQNSYTYKEMNVFLDGIAFLNHINNSIEKRMVTWTVNDFKRVAEEISDFYDFDESKYPLALRNMIDNHDLYVGINDDVIRMYLGDYCQKD